MVEIPKAYRTGVHFESHGKVFQVKRIEQQTWVLSCPIHSARARFGDRREIMEDIAHVLEFGSMPQGKSCIY